jgi:hypothetical protein
LHLQKVVLEQFEINGQSSLLHNHEKGE